VLIILKKQKEKTLVSGNEKKGFRTETKKLPFLQNFDYQRDKSCFFTDRLKNLTGVTKGQCSRHAIL